MEKLVEYLIVLKSNFNHQLLQKIKKTTLVHEYNECKYRSLPNNFNIGLEWVSSNVAIVNLFWYLKIYNFNISLEWVSFNVAIVNLFWHGALHRLGPYLYHTRALVSYRLVSYVWICINFTLSFYFSLFSVLLGFATHLWPLVQSIGD